MAKYLWGLWLFGWLFGWVLDVMAETLPDPTRPPDVPTISASEISSDPVPSQYVLEAILQGDERRVAIINGEMVREGQSVAGARVMRILPASVHLRVNGQAQILEWPALPVLRRPAGGSHEKGWINR